MNYSLMINSSFASTYVFDLECHFVAEIVQILSESNK